MRDTSLHVNWVVVRDGVWKDRCRLGARKTERTVEDELLSLVVASAFCGTNLVQNIRKSADQLLGRCQLGAIAKADLLRLK